MDSYRKAYDYFCGDSGEPLICMCLSWLIDPVNREILPPTSHFNTFADDFDIVGSVEDEGGFVNAWRVFGADADKDPAEWPERTSLQRAFKKHKLSDGKFGYGIGFLIFDGEKIVNKK